MAKAFSVVSWNCEHWKEKDPRNAARIDFLASQNADVIALYEVEGREVWRSVMDGLPGYSFFITEGQNTQEIAPAPRRRARGLGQEILRPRAPLLRGQKPH